MHILFFINSLAGGGAERVTANLANHWAGCGQRVTIVTLSDVVEDVYDLEPSVRRISLGLDRESPSFIVALYNNLRRVLALRSCLRSERPDVAIAMMTTANCLLALAGNRYVKVILGSERINPDREHLGIIWTTIRRISYQWLDAVVVQTTETKEWVERNTAAVRVEVIANPVIFPLPKGLPSIAPGRYLNSNLKMLLAVGRFSTQKAYDRLLEAFAEVSASFPNWRLAIVGDGPLLADMKKLADELAIESNVVFPGRVGNIGDWYSAANLFVMTSQYEGFPNALVEAMAHGLPVVSFDCDTGPRDIIRHEFDGILVPQDNLDILVSSLKLLMQDQVLRERFGDRATEIRERFSHDLIAREWEKTFQISF